MIGDSVTIIDVYAFGYCTSLTSIVIPDSVTWIGYAAFTGCTSLTSVVIPGSVTSIGSFAFHICPSLISIDFGGTRAQWSAIEFGDSWNLYTGNYTIYYTND